MDAAVKPNPKDMPVMKTTPAEVVGFIDLKSLAKQSKPAQATKQVKREFKQRMEQPKQAKRQERHDDRRPANMTQQAQELQFLKAQIKSLREDLNGYDDLRAAVALVVKADAASLPETLKLLKDTFTAL